MDTLIPIRLLHIAAGLGAFGVAAFACCLPPAAPAPWRQAWAEGLRRATFYCAAVAFATWLLWLPALAPAMTGLPVPAAWTEPVFETIITKTAFGTFWASRTAILLGLAVASSGCLLPRRLRPSATIVLAAAALALLPGAGHANRETGPAGLVHFGGDALHLLGAATWLGGLPPLLILLRMQWNGRAVAPIVAATLRRFSTLAAAGVAALVLGAAVNAWFMVPTLGYLTESAYGRMVAAKLVLLAAMLAMAAHNRFVLVPRLGAGGGGSARATAALFRNAALELAAGCAVLLIVSVLGVTSP